MNRFIGLLSLLVATPALAGGATVEYAHDFDFSQVKTFQYVAAEEADTDGLMMLEQTETDVKAFMAEAGLQETEGAADVMVTYHLIRQESAAINTAGYGYGGFAPGWGGWKGAVAQTTTSYRTFTQGTMVVDVYLAESKRMIFRGTAPAPITKKPQQQAAKIQGALNKLAGKWQMILQNEGK